MVEGLLLALSGILCFYFAAEQWFLAMSDARFLFVFGEQKARVLNVLIGAILLANGVFLMVSPT